MKNLQEFTDAMHKAHGTRKWEKEALVRVVTSASMAMEEIEKAYDGADNPGMKRHSLRLALIAAKIAGRVL